MTVKRSLKKNRHKKKKKPQSVQSVLRYGRKSDMLELWARQATKNDVLVNAGELVEMAGTTKKRRKYSSVYKESFIKAIVKICQNWGYKDGGHIINI